MDPPPPPPPTQPASGPAPAWSPPGAPVWPPPPQRHPRRGVFLVLLGIAILVAAAIIVVAATQGTHVSPTTTSYTDPTNHFSANFHDKPVEDDRSLTVGGRSIPEVLWTDTIDTNTAEIVGYASFPGDFSVATPHAALDGSVAGEVSNSHGTLVSKSFGTYQGFDSVDAVISLAGGYVESRAVLAGRTLYIVVVTSTSNPPELFASFANSLHVINHAG